MLSHYLQIKIWENFTANYYLNIITYQEIFEREVFHKKKSQIKSLKLVSAIFYQIFNFHQTIALQKLR